jgi:K+-transporting ATPase KdpF subunit
MAIVLPQFFSRLHAFPRQPPTDETNMLYTLMGILAACLLVYLFLALLKPELFP